MRDWLKKLCCICSMDYEFELTVPVPQPLPKGMFLTLAWRSKLCGEVSGLSVCVYVFSSSPKSHLQCLTVISAGHKDRSEFIWALPTKPMLASGSCWKALVYNSRPDHKSLQDLRLDNITAGSSRGGLFCASPDMRRLPGEKLHPAQSPPSGPVTFRCRQWGPMSRQMWPAAPLDGNGEVSMPTCLGKTRRPGDSDIWRGFCTKDWIK